MALVSPWLAKLLLVQINRTEWKNSNSKQPANNSNNKKMVQVCKLKTTIGIGSSYNVTFCSLCCFSFLSKFMALVNLASVSLLMLFGWTFAGSVKLGWTSLTVLKKSIDITTENSWIVLMLLLTFCNLKLWKSNKRKYQTFTLDGKKEKKKTFYSAISTQKPFHFRVP